jgi:molybdopterin converting factor subunit 1
MKVLYFAQTAEITSCRMENWDTAEPLSETEFWEEAIRRHPGLKPVRAQCRLAVDQSFADATTTIHRDSEVAVLPPVSGG